MSASQLIYDKLFEISEELGYDTYDFLPPENTSYPFVVVQSTQLRVNPTKTLLLGDIDVYIDIYGDESSRREVANIGTNLIVAATKVNIKGVRPLCSSTDYSIIQDQSTAVPLWHGRLFLTFKLI